MKTALVKFKDMRAGLLMETDEGYEFQYDAEYLVSGCGPQEHGYQ